MKKIFKSEFNLNLNYNYHVPWENRGSNFKDNCKKNKQTNKSLSSIDEPDTKYSNIR